MTGMLSQSELESLVAAGDIDTVIVAFCDMQGRLTGKRVSARLFVEDVAAHGAECCNYLLAVDVDMNTVDGYAISSWETGYGDMVMTPDFATLRLLPWLPGTALVMADLSWIDGNPVTQAPRSILQPPDRPARRARPGALRRHRAGVHGLRRHLPRGLGEGLPRAYTGHRLQRRLRDAGVHPDGAAAARHPAAAWTARACTARASRASATSVSRRSRSATTTRWLTCDNHTIYKNGAKEIADQHGKSLTFMAKFDEREGNSCHIHISLRGDDGGAVFADADDDLGMSPMFRSFIAGQLATLRELTLFYAPNINSYKRFVEGSFAPTAIAWGMDNRTCALRVVGHGHGMRMECRAPGGDVNQYLAVSALIAGGLHGIEQELELPEALEGNAYTSGAERLPTTLAEAAALFGKSEVAREAFGDDVVEHYLNNARVELTAFNAAVTDWERVRGFERL